MNKRGKKSNASKTAGRSIPAAKYDRLVVSIAQVLEAARRTSARAVNALMTATYWEIGRRIVEFEQKGSDRADYGEELLVRLSRDLTAKFGRGFAKSNLYQMRAFYLSYSGILQTVSGKSGDDWEGKIFQTASGKLPEASSSRILQTPSGESLLEKAAACFPLPWSAYVRLLSIKNEHARAFYETEALCGGWSVRQLDRQIDSQYYERTALSKNKSAMLAKGAKDKPGEAATPEEEIKDPYVLEFLGLRDEYSESDLEEALVRHLETFLLELGGDFCFIGRQKRLRIDSEWYRVDLLFFHRRLRCLVVVDLKLGRFTHADAGQMHLYLNYAAEHWTHPAATGKPHEDKRETHENSSEEDPAELIRGVLDMEK